MSKTVLNGAPTLKEVTEERYDEMLEVLMPTLWDWEKGFLVGEPCDGDEGSFRYCAFFRKDEEFYEAKRALFPTVARSDPITYPTIKAASGNFICPSSASCLRVRETGAP